MNPDYPTQSPPLSVISTPEITRPEYERRFLPRLSLGSEQFRLLEIGKIFSITDLSRQGMGFLLLDLEDRPFFSVGQKLEGILNLRREKYTLHARVRHLGMDRVGCEFEMIPPEMIQALDRFLNPLFLGAEMKPIPSSERNTLWYHGPSGTDLLLVRALDGQYEKLMLYVLGVLVQWDKNTGLSTSKTSISDQACERLGILRRETLFLIPDETPDFEKLSIAKTVILGSNLPQDLKTWCIRKLE